MPPDRGVCGIPVLGVAMDIDVSGVAWSWVKSGAGVPNVIISSESTSGVASRRTWLESFWHSLSESELRFGVSGARRGISRRNVEGLISALAFGGPIELFGMRLGVVGTQLGTSCS
jgi:hypothetical protein